MSNLEVAGVGNGLNFKWGVLKGIRNRNDRDIHYYDSFTYNGVQYHLYDCAVFYQHGNLETSIGKLVELYETPDHERKAKVIWFFRPIEICNFLGNCKPSWNELFLACGEGKGLSNINPVEAVIGKCNVVCKSKDGRNPPASEAELNRADYIFYRAFDVGKYTILEKFADKIVGIRVENFFNRKNDLKLIGSNNYIANVEERSKYSNSLSKSGLDKVVHNEVNDHKPIGLNNVGANVREQTRYSNSSSIGGLDKGIYNGVKDQKLIDSNNVKAKVEERTEYSNSPSKIGVDNGVYNGMKDHKLIDSNIVRAKVEERTKYSNSPSKIGLHQVFRDGMKDDKSSCFVRSGVKDSSKHAASERELSDIQPFKKRKLAQNADAFTTTQNMAPPEVKDFDGVRRTSDKAVLKFPLTNDVKADSKFLKVTARPDAERRSWFRQSHWEEKLEVARESGTLVLLQNLDPSYTSFEVEDIIWSALQERVEAKMIQQSTFSSPHYGRALVIFKSTEVAEWAVSTLRSRCLMLAEGSGRPVVAQRKTRAQRGQLDSFYGHLTLDVNKFQKQREEMRNAVSTSHCSQPNTSEYDLAMDWCLLHEKSDSWWKALHRRQKEEIQNLVNQGKKKLA